MIYTVTLNPSIDYVVEVPDFALNGVNRTEKEVKYPGGKGINVSRVLQRLNVPSKALGFIGGFTGSFIKEKLETEGVTTQFIEVAGDSRINIKLKTDTETEINGTGPTIPTNKLQQLIEQINTLQKGDTLVLAGSIPNSLPENLYETLTKIGTNRGIRVAVDASKKILLDVVCHKPFVVKPNHHELGELFNTEINSVTDAVQYGRKLAEMGAQHVIVSMAGDGAVLLTENETYFATVPKGNVINSVGAGDSLVAGFLGRYVQTQNILEAFRYGVATGSATAFSSDLTTRDTIERLLPQVKVTVL
ncbi:1-phosphofructokinase [Ectobacillus antri]|jgi:1-phosphofructokinase|uniref:Tagatose-6-phosphate kinase n=1 Tax=Ectobacillus antri TaxID=2486280 RepID=A0ABT6H132_9BACI|nr:1-phosphofructokinase [Ectobacillus antri]MDG4655346.1 1-phosphofructokinase [Ectobacillus antri]MDG5753104.1 1-phosphofructokinase [Ectobacillus antri]